MEWLLWFRDSRVPLRESKQAYAALSAELPRHGLLPIGTLSGVFGKPGNWVIRVGNPGQHDTDKISLGAKHAGKAAGFSLERRPQQAPPSARR